MANFGERVTRSFAWTHLYKFAEYGLINLYNVLVIRHFGPELVGPYALYLSVGTVLSLIGAFAVDGVLLRFTSHAFDRKSDQNDLLRDPQRFIQKLFAFRLVIIAAIAVVSSVSVIAISQIAPTWIPASSAVLVLMPYVVLFLFAQAVTAFSTFTMMGLLEAKQVFFSSLISRSILIGLGFLALTGDALDLERAVQIHVGTTVLHATMLFIAMKKVVLLHAKEAAISWLQGVGSSIIGLLRSRKTMGAFLGSSVIAYGITTWGTDLLSSVLSRQPDVLMLSAILGENSSQVGYYQVGAMVLLLAEYALLFGLGGTLVAAFSTLSREDELTGEQGAYSRLASARRKVFNFQLAATTPLFMFVIFYAEPIIEFLFGTAFLPAVTMVQVGIAVLLIAVGVVGGGMHVTTLVSIGKQKTVFNIRLIWGAINLVGNYFLILWLGALGALLGTQLANLGACVCEGVIADKTVGTSRSYSAIVNVFLVAVLAISIPWIALNVAGIGGITALILGSAASLALYLLMSVLFKLGPVLLVLDRLSTTFLKRPLGMLQTGKEVLS